MPRPNYLLSTARPLLSGSFTQQLVESVLSRKLTKGAVLGLPKAAEADDLLIAGCLIAIRVAELLILPGARLPKPI